jgi:very-short-patch-repair endonuclease
MTFERKPRGGLGVCLLHLSMPGRRKIIPYNARMKEYAREFRNNPTPTEAMLWEHLKGKQMKGYDFHRQKPLGNFVVDFFCHELMLAIEIDGRVHNDDYRKEKDAFRQDLISGHGVRFLRFSAERVKQSVDEVLSEIGTWIDENAEITGE